MVETKAASDGLARRGLRVAGLAGESRVGGSGLLCLSAASDRVVGAALVFLWAENYPYLKRAAGGWGWPPGCLAGYTPGLEREAWGLLTKRWRGTGASPGVLRVTQPPGVGGSGCFSKKLGSKHLDGPFSSPSIFLCKGP